jgi:hypothetical protein
MSLWNGFSKPAAVCQDCFCYVNRQVIRQLYILRCQVRQLHVDLKNAVDTVNGIKQDLDELYQMYVELSERVV